MTTKSCGVRAVRNFPMRSALLSASVGCHSYRSRNADLETGDNLEIGRISNSAVHDQQTSFNLSAGFVLRKLISKNGPHMHVLALEGKRPFSCHTPIDG